MGSQFADGSLVGVTKVNSYPADIELWKAMKGLYSADLSIDQKLLAFSMKN